MSTNIKEIKMTDDTRLALLEHIVNHINESLAKIDLRFDKIDHRFDSIDTNLSTLRSGLNDEFKEIRQEMSSQNKWLLGIMIALFSGIYATMFGQMIAKIFHLM